MNRKFAIAMAMGFECVGLVTALLFVGQYFDHKYGWPGTATAIGAVAGVVGWFLHLILMLKQLSSESKTDASPDVDNTSHKDQQ